MTITALITADLYYRANLCVSKDAKRYNLRSVYVKPHKDGGLVLCAFNGPMGVIIRDFDGFASEPFKMSLPNSMLKDCKFSRMRPNLMIQINDGKAVLNGVTTDDWLDQNSCWIDIDCLMPKITPTMKSQGNFSTKLLFDLSKSLNDNGNDGLVIKGDDPNHVHAVFGSLSNAFGLIMPIFMDDSKVDQVIPNWVN